MAKKPTTIKKKKKIKKIVPKGKIYIQSTFNNTTITLTDEKGNVLSWSSAGTLGYKGTRKSTPYAAGLAAKKVAEEARNYQTGKIDVIVRGVGSGRESAIRALNSSGMEVLSIKDITPIPHNGPRPKKPRRV
ncbi:30S ribosomal protein S11 [bacterium CG_4_10_14_0_2_um_filter_33_32]|nr:MAG: 30S ribosomal protein S11 [bacterium CG2_30_33_46]PIR67382.1 MAG: 30S ribosomal protein S11 [bacterium CG10_big_fil_rev_8_21_14_0_10_33_18]PIU76770.1 MAG: 30S ribosomal protein S11 [bacterium CG06_land_8_20_14_3_00_33_50]PIW81285.1 MAG: 30S ribosomal protein S11 [bacterium CG_4_8_14_3_um_filter_33_28]PIY85726.1 MAG: 30S ribosomal protein S11 [bacterium CG_4_10_14_0_8_um_filter_33_57]PIZ86571.1 MAG: 30S ribosomal protein S11 [bacterium CG_4_10_14_0_2_um_filter_33_32]PJA72100.1 MAG: 30S